MKKLTKLLALTLVLSLALLSLASCDKSDSIKKAFEEEGYTVSVFSARNEKAKAVFTLMGYTAEEIDEIEDYELIHCVDGLKNVVIVKYPSVRELKDELIDDGSSAYYDEEKEAGRINGNCHLVFDSFGVAADATEIFAGK